MLTQETSPAGPHMWPGFFLEFPTILLTSTKWSEMYSGSALIMAKQQKMLHFAANALSYPLRSARQPDQPTLIFLLFV